MGIQTTTAILHFITAAKSTGRRGIHGRQRICQFGLCIDLTS